MNKKVIIIVLVILIVLVLIFCIKPKNKTNESNNIDVTNTANEVVETKTNAVELKKSLGAVKCEEASDLAIKDFISKYDESTFYVKSEWYPTEIYFIFDFNNDDNKDCLLIYDNMLYLYQLIDDEVKIRVSNEFNLFENMPITFVDGFDIKSKEDVSLSSNLAIIIRTDNDLDIPVAVGKLEKNDENFRFVASKSNINYELFKSKKKFTIYLFNQESESILEEYHFDKLRALSRKGYYIGLYYNFIKDIDGIYTEYSQM